MSPSAPRVVSKIMYPPRRAPDEFVWARLAARRAKGHGVIGASRWHAILSRPCQKGARDLDRARLSAFVPRRPRGGTPVAFPTRAPGGKRQKRDDGAWVRRVQEGELLVGKILVVDDEEQVRSLLVEHFQREGFVVLEAADGEEALQAVRRTRPDLVVLDVGLPGMDGLQVLRRIRREDPGIGVIVVSGKSESVVAKTLEAGALGYFLKPFDLERLSQAVRTSVELFQTSSDRHWAAINVSRIEDATLIVAQGSLDTLDAERMKRVLDNLLEDGRAKLVVDLVGVTSIDSSGVGALVGAMKRARAAGGTLRLCGLQGDVRSVFETSGLTARLEVHASREEAISP
ncbi:MAG: hypothetical protein DME17_00815 [Candidatus Rokuibacteriota bacterium]|nr:MAG: hypothetical protein DME17_00815 [Candidatus Rokubacteria bacterium]